MNFLLMLLAMLAVVVTQLLAGGRQLALCLPGYGLLAVAAIMSWWPTRRTPVPRAITECLITGLLLFSYVAIRAILSPEEYIARKDLFLAFGGVALYLLVALNLTSSKLRLWFVAGLLLLGLANCAVGASQFSKGQNFMAFDFLPRSDYGSRVSGFFGYPNALATFLGVIFMLGLSVVFWSRWAVWAKVIAGYVTFVCLVGILFTGSRGGYISCAVGLLVFTLLSLRLVGRLALTRAITLVIVGASLILALGWGVQQLQSRSFLLKSRTSQTLTLDPSRAHMWRAAWKQFQINPIVGTGSGTHLYYGRQFRNPAIQADPVHAHNEYLHLLAEYGILGIALLVIFLETHLRNGWKTFTRRTSHQDVPFFAASNSLALNVGAFCAAVTCLAHSFMEFNLHMPANVLLMAFVFGLLASPGETQETAAESESEPGLPAYFRLLLPAFGLWLAIRALPTLPSEYFGERARLVVSNWQMMVSPEVPQNAENLARSGLPWDSRNPELYFYIGEAQSALASQATNPAEKADHYARSVEAYEKAVALAPGDVRLVLCEAWSLDALQRFQESAPLFERALKMDPLSGNVRYAYATHLHTTGKLPEAAAQYRESLRLGGAPAAQDGLNRLMEEMKAQATPAR